MWQHESAVSRLWLCPLKLGISRVWPPARIPHPPFFVTLLLGDARLLRIGAPVLRIGYRVSAVSVINSRGHGVERRWTLAYRAIAHSAGETLLRFGVDLEDCLIVVGINADVGGDR